MHRWLLLIGLCLGAPCFGQPSELNSLLLAAVPDTAVFAAIKAKWRVGELFSLPIADTTLVAKGSGKQRLRSGAGDCIVKFVQIADSFFIVDFVYTNYRTPNASFLLERHWLPYFTGIPIRMKFGYNGQLLKVYNEVELVGQAKKMMRLHPFIPNNVAGERSFKIMRHTMDTETGWRNYFLDVPLLYFATLCKYLKRHTPLSDRIALTGKVRNPFQEKVDEWTSVEMITRDTTGIDQFTQVWDLNMTTAIALDVAQNAHWEAKRGWYKRQVRTYDHAPVTLVSRMRVDGLNKLPLALERWEFVRGKKLDQIISCFIGISTDWDDEIEPRRWMAQPQEDR